MGTLNAHLKIEHEKKPNVEKISTKNNGKVNFFFFKRVE